MELRKYLEREFPLFISLPAILWQLLFLFIPVAITAYLSLIDNQTGAFTLRHYMSLLDPAYLHIIMRSIGASLGTACCCLLLAYPVAYFLAVHAGRLKNALLFLAMVPFWTNFLVQIYAWFFLLEYNGLISMLLTYLGFVPMSLANNFFAIVLVMVYCYLPIMIMPLYIVLEKLDLRLLEVSADLGAKPWQTFVNVTLPLSFSGIRTGLLLVLIPSFGEFSIPALLGGGKYMFVGSLISFYSLVVRNKGLSAAFTMISGIAFLLLVTILMGIMRSLWGEKEVAYEQ